MRYRPSGAIWKIPTIESSKIARYLPSARRRAAWLSSLRRQATMQAALWAVMNAPWMPAQIQGLFHAAGWLYTAVGDMTPTTPWWATTYPIARRNGSQS